MLEEELKLLPFDGALVALDLAVEDGIFLHVRSTDEVFAITPVQVRQNEGRIELIQRKEKADLPVCRRIDRVGQEWVTSPDRGMGIKAFTKTFEALGADLRYSEY